MKKILLLPVLGLLCFGCNPNDMNNSNRGQSQESSSDWSITTKVKAEIMADSTLSASARFVSVTTTDGVVTLTGSVPSREDKDRIGRIARNVAGVKRVDNQIMISNK